MGSNDRLPPPPPPPSLSLCRFIYPPVSLCASLFSLFPLNNSDSHHEIHGCQLFLGVDISTGHPAQPSSFSTRGKHKREKTSAAFSLSFFPLRSVQLSLHTGGSTGATPKKRKDRREQPNRNLGMLGENSSLRVPSPPCAEW